SRNERLSLKSKQITCVELRRRSRRSETLIAYKWKKRIDSCDSPEASVFVMFNHVADLVSFNRTFISSVTAATVVLGLLRKVAIFGN
ncbi:hypothetical protein CICLE_v10013707mg, partial [Citrus x clementina]